MLKQLTSKLDVLFQEKECPGHCLESMHTVFFAAPHLEIDELKKFADHFKGRFGKKFHEAAMNGPGPDCHVNREVRDKLDSSTPNIEVVIGYLKDLAAKKKFYFDPKSLAYSSIGLNKGDGDALQRYAKEMEGKPEGKVAEDASSAPKATSQQSCSGNVDSSPGSSGGQGQNYCNNCLRPHNADGSGSGGQSQVSQDMTQKLSATYPVPVYNPMSPNPSVHTPQFQQYHTPFIYGQAIPAFPTMPYQQPSDFYNTNHDMAYSSQAGVPSTLGPAPFIYNQQIPIVNYQLYPPANATSHGTLDEGKMPSAPLEDSYTNLKVSSLPAATLDSTPGFILGSAVDPDTLELPSAKSVFSRNKEIVNTKMTKTLHESRASGGSQEGVSYAVAGEEPVCNSPSPQHAPPGDKEAPKAKIIDIDPSDFDDLMGNIAKEGSSAPSNASSSSADVSHAAAHISTESDSRASVSALESRIAALRTK